MESWGPTSLGDGNWKRIPPREWWNRKTEFDIVVARSTESVLRKAQHNKGLENNRTEKYLLDVVIK